MLGSVLLLAGAWTSAKATEWPNIFGMLPTEDHYELKLLGKFVFFDPISVDGNGNPADMSCASCHDPASGGTNPDEFVNATQVAVTGANTATIGTLKPPSAHYAALIPAFEPCNIGGVGIGGGGPGGQRWCGGNFYNGRSVGYGGTEMPGSTHVVTPDVLGSKLEYIVYLTPSTDQSLNPFANHVEQNVPVSADDGDLPGATHVCTHVQAARYSILYDLAWGEPIDCSPARVEQSFQRIAVAIGAYESSNDWVNWTSKRDFALRAELMCVENHPARARAVCEHPDYINSPGTFPLVWLTASENRGHDLFYNTAAPFGPPQPPPFPDLPVTMCSFCHVSDEANPDGTGLFERYTDDAYHNIGTPKNPELPAEPLLADHVGSDDAVGGVRTPHLRNLTKSPQQDFLKAFGHNGWFKSLEGIVHFYNTSFLGNCSLAAGDCPPPRPGPFGPSPYEETTAYQYGITRCDGPLSEAEAIAQNCWPEPAWPETTAPSALVGDLGMTPQDEADLVAYLETLDDYATAREPRNLDILIAVIRHYLGL